MRGSGRTDRPRQLPIREGEEDALPDLNLFGKDAVEHVTKIQASARGLLVRRQTAAHRASAPHHAPPAACSSHRGHLKEEDAAKHAKTHTSGDMPDLATFSDADTARLTRLQASARGHLSRKKTREIVQKSPVAVTSRKPVDLPDLASFTEEDTVKLTRIQAGARGHLARKSMNSGPAHAQRQSEEKPQPTGRATAQQCKSDLPNLSSFTEDDCAKVTKIQAGTRGLLARRSSQKQRAAGRGAHGASARRAPAEMQTSVGEHVPDLDSFSQEDTVKLTKIQAGARGMLARKKSVERHGRSNRQTQPTAPAEDLPQLAQFTKDDTAKLTKIQANARGAIARKQTREMRDARTQHGIGNPASCPRKKAAGTAPDLPDLSSFSEEDTAKLTKIQAGARGLLVRKQAGASPKAASSRRRPRDRGGQHETLPDLESYSEEDAARLTKIQAGARGMLARKQGASHAGAGRQARAPRGEALPDLAQFSEEDTTKLTRIQAGARGFLARQQVKENQPGFRAGVARRGKKQDGLPDLNSFSEVDTTKLTRVQANARGHLARKRLQDQRSAAEVTLRHGSAEGIPDLQAFGADDTAKLTKIQAVARGNFARKRTQELSASATREGRALAVTDSTPQKPEAPPIEHLPVRPPGQAPRERRPRPRPQEPPDPAKVLSKEALTRRAEKRLERVMHSTLTNVPTCFPNTHDLPRVQLARLSERAREGILRAERLEAQAWLKEANMQVEAYKQREEVEVKLQEWHAQREAVKFAEAERQRDLAEEKAKHEEETRRKWKRRGLQLQGKVANWGAEKAEREEREEREKAAQLEAAKKLEAEKMLRHRRRLKRKLARWHAGEESLDATKGVPESQTGEACGGEAEAQHSGGDDRPENLAEMDALGPGVTS